MTLWVIAAGMAMLAPAYSVDEAADLSFLRTAIGDARIVQLGENNHGIADYNEIKTRLVRELHEQEGFNVIAFESDFYQCADTERRIGDMPVRRAMQSCLFGVWHTEEVEQLFVYILATHTTDRPLHIAGFDVQPIGSNKAHRPQWLAEAAGATGLDSQLVKSADERFLELYALSSRERRAAWRGLEGKRLQAHYEWLERAFRHVGNGEASRVAGSLAAFLGQERAATTVERVEARDRGMADNLLYLADEHYPGEKMIVWGHNFHLREANEKLQPHPDMFINEPARSAGHWLTEAKGADVFTVGFYAIEGQARNNRGARFVLVPAAEGSLERQVQAMLPEAGAVWSDIDDVAQPTSARYDAQHPITGDWSQQYDAVVVVGQARASASFYGD